MIGRKVYEWQLTDTELAALKRDRQLGRYVGRLEERGNDEAAFTGRKKLLAMLRLERQLGEEIDRREGRETTEARIAALETELRSAKGQLAARDKEIEGLRRQREAIAAGPAMAEYGEAGSR